MTFNILTLFPETFESVFEKSIIKRALDKKIVKINLINIRDYGLGVHKQVDDKPYGGGEGMVMMVEPIEKAIKAVKPKPYTILLSPSGKKYSQKEVKRLSKKNNLAIICGHYEGVDARVEKYVDEVLSVGDFVLTGGEIPAMILVDTITRLLPGVINEKSPAIESFENALLEYPQYTRPEVYKGLKVPQVLLSGNHKEINMYREKESGKRTQQFRPDLLSKKS